VTRKGGGWEKFRQSQIPESGGNERLKRGLGLKVRKRKGIWLEKGNAGYKKRGGLDTKNEGARGKRSACNATKSLGRNQEVRGG